MVESPEITEPQQGFFKRGLTNEQRRLERRDLSSLRADAIRFVAGRDPEPDETVVMDYARRLGVRGSYSWEKLIFEDGGRVTGTTERFGLGNREYWIDYRTGNLTTCIAFGEVQKPKSS
jgi:hypothetical protein